jgi:hypothetical protein
MPHDGAKRAPPVPTTENSRLDLPFVKNHPRSGAHEPLILTGFVSFRFQLRHPCNDTAAPTRRKRRLNGDGGNNSSNESICEGASSLGDPDAPVVGYVLRDETRNDDYLLSVPQQQQRLVGLAASNQWRVQVSTDRILDVRNGSSEFHETNGEGLRGFVEASDLKVLSNEPVLDLDPNSFLSLAQVRQVEELDQAIGAPTKRWNVKATVLAVSPILTTDPTDPYSLVELLDAGAACTGVAILRKDALVHQMSIAPGQTLFLRRARRRAWNVHETLLHADPDAPPLPSKVLLVDQPDQIGWPSSTSSISSVGEAATTLPEANSCLETISGEVVRVRTIYSRKDDTSPRSEHLHSIELAADPDPASLQSTTLFVTYFPLPTSLLLSIRQGARILVTGVRPIAVSGEDCYCATLRSHISLLSHAPSNLREHVRLTDKEVAVAMHPCRTPPARMSYVELCARRAMAALVDPWVSGVLASSRPPCPKMKDVADAYLRSAGLVTKSQHTGRTVQRDTSAEFFRGGVGLCQNLSNLAGDSCGPSPALGTDSVHVMRVPMKVDEIFGASLRVLSECLDEHVKSNLCSFGSVGCIHRSGGELLEENSIALNDGRARPVTFGLASSVKTSGEQTQAVLSGGGLVSLPCVFRPTLEVSTGASRYIFAAVESFIASFLCLGVCETTSTEAVGGGSHLHTPHSSPDACGTCEILVVQGCAFLVGIRLECSDSVVFRTHQREDSMSTNKDPNSVMSDGGSVSIQECLVGPPRDESGFVFGLLTRKTFRAFKAANGIYKGCTVTLTHLPSSMPDFRVDDVYTAQSIDLKLSISVDDLMLIHLRRRLASTVCIGLPDRHLLVACIWWQVATRAPLLLDGGWDEFVPNGSSIAESSGVVVRAPLSAAHLEPSRGYMRFACEVDDLCLTSIQFRPPSTGLFSSPRSLPPIDFAMKKRVLPGDLSPRPLRRVRTLGVPSVVTIGELRVPAPRHAGISKYRLADLFDALVADLASKARTRVAPSLVREVRSAKLLGISYCQVVAECPACFKALVAPKAKSRASDSTSVSKGRLDENGETLLRCPDQCPPAAASVKWECSGTLDDGTGQAKLYAEREAAIALLGMSDAMFRDVEAAALSAEGGLVYSKGLPPRPDLVVALDTARHRSLQSLQSEWSVQPQRRRARITEDDILQRLSPYDRGDLLLQRHCRCSRTPTRELVYYVRCKPVSDEVLRHGMLNPSEIDVLRPGVGGGRSTIAKRATYTLPPLKLVLVDVASPSATFEDDLE